MKPILALYIWFIDWISGVPLSHTAAGAAPETSDDEDLARPQDVSTADQAKIEERRQRIFNDQKDVTGRIGETSRYIGFGGLAVFYTVISSDKPTPELMKAEFGGWVAMLGIFSIATILADYLQYISGYISDRSALTRADGKAVWSRSWLSYRARHWFFVTKQIAALGASLVLIVAMILTALREAKLSLSFF